MQKRIPIKNHHLEIQLIARRSIVALVFICFLIICLIIRLAFLQISRHDVYSTLATKNWLDLVPVEPTRGLIYDRNGVLLAENIPIFSLDITPVQIIHLDQTLKALTSIITLSDDDISQFKKQLKQRRRFESIPIKYRLTDDEVARFAENQFRFPGVAIKARLMRYYPHGEHISHVLGYVGRINTQELTQIDQTNYSASHYIGKLGIEKYYEDELHGQVGYQEVENDASGKPLRILKEIQATPGKNIYLTIDSKLQLAATNALQGKRGAIVAIQPSTGQILAMVSEPSYDPNLFVTGISKTDYQALQESLDKPLYDRTLRGLYPLASTIKPFLALAGLHFGFVDLDYAISDPGWFELRNSSHRYHDWWRGGHGIVNVSKAITSSCDTFFYELATRMGIKRMDIMLAQFGFGSLTGIDIEDELPGILASPEWKHKMRGAHWYEGDTVISGIGQGFMQTTPLQLATATATLANRGKRYIPYLALAEQTPGKPVQTQQPTLLETITVTDNHYWDIVINAMRDVVDAPHGTAKRYGSHPGYSIAAKTGTAQVIRKRNPDQTDNQDALPERFRDHHLFIAFAPVENPQLALAIVSENSNVAIEAARTIFDYYLGQPANVRTDQKPPEKTGE